MYRKNYIDQFHDPARRADYERDLTRKLEKKLYEKGHEFKETSIHCRDLHLDKQALAKSHLKKEITTSNKKMKKPTLSPVRINHEN